MNRKDPHRYDDLIDLPRHIAKNRKQMSMHDRAAQFAPFAALSGYHESIEETARQTGQAAELDESALEELNLRFQIIAEHIHEHPLITITYFIPDGRKEGGRYETVSFRVRKADLLRRLLIAQDGEQYETDRIIRIESPLIQED